MASLRQSSRVSAASARAAEAEAEAAAPRVFTGTTRGAAAADACSSTSHIRIVMDSALSASASASSPTSALCSVRFGRRRATRAATAASRRAECTPLRLLLYTYSCTYFGYRSSGVVALLYPTSRSHTRTLRLTHHYVRALIFLYTSQLPVLMKHLCTRVKFLEIHIIRS